VRERLQFGPQCPPPDTTTTTYTHPSTPTRPSRCPCAPAGGPWKLFRARPDATYALYSDGGGLTLNATFRAGGGDGRATYMQAASLAVGGGVRVTAVLGRQPNGKWVLAGEGWLGPGAA
jgi:hypothetical protein